MLWRLFSLLTIAVAVRPMMDDSSNTKVSVGKKFCRLFPEKGAGDCLEQVGVQGGMDRARTICRNAWESRSTTTAYPKIMWLFIRMIDC